MQGKLYGIGVGPGDPELLTLKAVRLIQESDVIALPVKNKEKSVAYQIIKSVIPNIDSKPALTLDMPMTKDQKQLAKSHSLGVSLVKELLDKGLTIAFLTLGDPCIYSTYLYIHKKIMVLGYPCEIISGIPSFCAVSAKLQMGLVEKAEALHIIPASYDIKEALHLTGTKVLMKAGKNIKEVKRELKHTNASVLMIENCGMQHELIYRSIDEIPDNAGYYSLIIVKEGI